MAALREVTRIIPRASVFVVEYVVGSTVLQNNGTTNVQNYKTFLKNEHPVGTCHTGKAKMTQRRFVTCSDAWVCSDSLCSLSARCALCGRVSLRLQFTVGEQATRHTSIEE